MLLQIVVQPSRTNLRVEMSFGNHGDIFERRPQHIRFQPHQPPARVSIVCYSTRNFPCATFAHDTGAIITGSCSSAIPFVAKVTVNAR